MCAYAFDLGGGAHLEGLVPVLEKDPSHAVLGPETRPQSLRLVVGFDGAVSVADDDPDGVDAAALGHGDERSLPRLGGQVATGHGGQLSGETLDAAEEGHRAVVDSLVLRQKVGHVGHDHAVLGNAGAHVAQRSGVARRERRELELVSDPAQSSAVEGNALLATELRQLVGAEGDAAPGVSLEVSAHLVHHGSVLVWTQSCGRRGSA